MEMTRKNARQIREKCVENMAQFAEDNGLQIMPASARFGPTSVTIKLEFARVDPETGQAQDRKAQAFSQLATAYGLDPDWLGKCFISNGKEFRIVGLNTRAPKFPVMCERTKDGKRFKFKEATIEQRMTDTLDMPAYP